MLSFLTIIFLSAISIDATSLTRRDAPKARVDQKTKTLNNPNKSCGDGQASNLEEYKYKLTLAKDPKFNPESDLVDFKFSAMKKKEAFYIVQEGDDLWKIAGEFAPAYDVNKAAIELAEKNSIKNPQDDWIYAGQPLRFPEYFTIPKKDGRFQILGHASKKSYYMVAETDDVWKIAVLLAPHRASAAMIELATLNHLVDLTIYGGQLLVLPEDFARLTNGKNFVELASCRK
jgi:LysM repeat protein